MVSTQAFDPYGNPLASGGEPYGYTGEWWQEDVGLLHLRARWYDPASGTFLSVDPWEHSSNRYNYVNGNPTNWVDPLGWFYCNPTTGYCPETGQYLCVVQGVYYGDRGKDKYGNRLACIVNPDNMQSGGRQGSMINRPVTTLNDMPDYWWVVSPVARPPRVRIIQPINPNPSPDDCNVCIEKLAKVIRDQYLAPHSYFVKLNIDPELGLTFPVESGVETGLTPVIIAVNPMRLAEVFGGRPVNDAVKTFSAVDVAGTISSPQGVSAEAELMFGYLNSEELGHLAGSEICANFYLGVDTFVYGGPIVGGGLPLRGDIRELIDGRPQDFYGQGFIFDDTTGQLVYTKEVGAVVGFNTIPNAGEWEFSLSHGINKTIETQMEIFRQ